MDDVQSLCQSGWEIHDGYRTRYDLWNIKTIVETNHAKEIYLIQFFLATNVFGRQRRTGGYICN
jgi:hypothetical protein